MFVFSYFPCLISFLWNFSQTIYNVRTHIAWQKAKWMRIKWSLRCLEWLKRDILNIRWCTWLWLWGDLNIWLFRRRRFQTTSITWAIWAYAAIACVVVVIVVVDYCGIGASVCVGTSWIAVDVVRLWNCLSCDIHRITQSLMLFEQIFQFIHTRFQVLLQIKQMK